MTARHCVGSFPAAAAAVLRAGWDRGIDLPSVVASMEWSILHPSLPWLPCGLGSSLGTAGTAGGGRARSPLLPCPFGLPSPCPSPGQGYRDGSCDTEWQPGPGSEFQKSVPSLAGINCTGCGGDRQVTAVVSRLLPLPGAEDRVQQPWGWTRVACTDFPGREWLVLFFPHTELLAKLGTFQSALLSLGFPPDCWSERKQVRRQQRAGQSGPALCLSCPCSSVAWVTTDMGQGGVREEVSRLELHVEFATDMSGKGHGRHWASASFCDSCRASLGHICLGAH